MSAAEPFAPPDAPARLLWLNGPYGVGKGTLAAYLRDHWRIAMLDAEEIGVTLQRGLPPEHDPGDLHDLVVWPRSLLRLGTEFARVWPPLVVMPATLYHSAAVTQLLDRFRRAHVDVFYVTLTAEETQLRTRIHERPIDRDAKRWAIKELRPALAGLNQVRDGVQLNTTGLSPAQLAIDLANALRTHGWLTEDGQWTTAALAP